MPTFDVLANSSDDESSNEDEHQNHDENLHIDSEKDSKIQSHHQKLKSKMTNVSNQRILINQKHQEEEEEEEEEEGNLESDLDEEESEEEDHLGLENFSDLEGMTLLGDNVVSKELIAAAIATVDTSNNKKIIPTGIQKSFWNTFADSSTQSRNVIGIARTGSGKTLAFLVPAVALVLNQRKSSLCDEEIAFSKPLVAIVAPTRELAGQIFIVAKIMSTHSMATQFRVGSALGGTNYHEEVASIRKINPEIVIGTLGRILSFCGEVPYSNQQRQSMESESRVDEADICLNLKAIHLLVLDEGDRLLDMGFHEDLKQLRKIIPASIQVIITSATWEPDIIRDNAVAKLFLGDTTASNRTIMISHEDAGMVASKTVTQVVEVIKEKGSHRFRRLISVLQHIFEQRENARVFVFVMFKKEAKTIADQINAACDHNALCLNGDMTQSARFEAVSQFKSGEVNILVATDVAARGLDIKGVTDVINYSFGMTVEGYIHRIGRCGRSGTYGYSHTFFLREDEKFAPDLVKILREANQAVPDDLRIIGNKMAKKQATRAAGSGSASVRQAKPKQLTEEEEDRLEAARINREKQLQRKADQNKKGNHGKQRRRR